VQVALEEAVPVFVAGMGNPGWLAEDAHAQGMKVMALIGNAKQAYDCQNSGCDYVIGVGHEAGGHTGRVGTMALIPAVVDSVDIPVLAGGGIADGRGLAAVLMLGAQGVWVGTRFVATKEANTHPRHKQRIVESQETATAWTRGFTGKTARCFRNQITDYYERHPEELQPFPSQLYSVKESFRAGMRDGDYEGFMPAGQISGIIHDVPSARDVVAQIVIEARSVLARFGLSAQALT
jgi:NAD(P)H-dependent flavin oxidoreductase YrpB (nitropropane dioxygenase family)